MKQREKEILADLLELAADKLYHISRCNDFKLANTPENQALYVKVAQWSGQFQQEGSDFMIKMNETHIFFSDAILMSYFADMLRKE